MRRTIVLLAALTLVAAACGGDDDTEGTSAPADTTATAPAETTAAPATTVSESTGTGDGGLVIAAVNFSANEIVLRNDGSEPYDLSGHWLCNRPAYVEIAAQTLAPGESVTLAADSIGVGADGGEVGVYTARDFGSAAAMAAYVKWGAAGGGRFDTAVEAGLWTDGEFVDNAGADITLTGDPVSASGWGS